MTDYKPIPRNLLNKRRTIYMLVTVAVCAGFALLLYRMNESLRHSSYLTGYVLLGSILFLAAFNIRKKLAFLPNIGSASTWMQLHIYVGLSTFLIFGFHVAWQVPNGWLEGFLAILFITVALSGVYGLVITRVIPKRLTAIGEEVIFERIPLLRTGLAYEAKQTALGSLESSDVLSSFYLSRLLPFFEKPRSVGYLMFPNGRTKRQLVGELNGLQRYLSSDHRQIGTQLVAFVQRKDDLDYHYALQGRLKLWMFLHVGFTYSLLAISIIHTVLVHAFVGGGLP